MRCDSVAYEATRVQAQERGINHRGLPSVNNFSSYLSNGFEAYDVPSAPRDLIAASPAALTSAAFLNFSVPLTDNNNRIREYEIGWQNAEAGKAASDSGVQMMQPAQIPSLVVRNLTNAESYSLRARAHNRAGAGPWSTWTSVEVIPGRFSGVASSFSRTDAGSLAVLTLDFTTMHELASDGAIEVELPRRFPDVDGASCVLSLALDGTPEGSAAVSSVRKGRGVVLSVNLTAVTSHSIPAATTVSLTLSPVELPRFTGETGSLLRVATLDRWAASLASFGERAPVDEASTAYHDDSRFPGLLVTPGLFRTRAVAELSSLMAGESVTVTLTLNLSNPIPPRGLILVTFPSGFTTVPQPTAEWGSGSEDFDATRFGLLDFEDALSSETTLVWRRGAAESGTTDIGDGRGTGALALLLDGFTNPPFSGHTGSFPLVRTMIANGTVIDEASSDWSSEMRPSSLFMRKPMSR